MYSTIALRAALGNVSLQDDEDGLFAVFEDIADRLWLRAVVRHINVDIVRGRSAVIRSRTD